MKKIKLLLVVALVFLAGMATGVVGTRIVVRHIVGEAISHPESVPTHIERNLTFRLRLDNGQRVKLHEIISEAHGQLKDLRREYRPKVVLVLSNANDQIIALLTPEQAARFDKWKKENHPLLEAIRQNQ